MDHDFVLVTGATGYVGGRLIPALLESGYHVRAMARNIDQAKLNRVYYDYFFEGLMKTLITTWLPLLLMLAYVNHAFNPAALTRLFARETLFEFHTIKASAVFWYFVSALLSFIGIAVARYLYKRKTQPAQ